MRNKLVKTIAGIVIPIVMGTAGCSTLPKREYPEGQIHGVEYNIVTQEKVPYNLEEQVMYGERQYFYEGDQTELTLPIEILRYIDVTRELDLDSGKTELQSDKIYVPTKVEVEEYTKNKWADEIVLRTNGLYGMQADMISLEEAKKENNAREDIYGYKIVTTEDGASFLFKTIKILEEEYFFPYVGDSKINEEGKLNYYLIPVKGAQIKIQNKCGNLIIRNEDQIYRPILKIEEENIPQEFGLTAD